MTSLHECSDLCLPVEEEGQWIVNVGNAGWHAHIGPFSSAFEAGEWARLHVGDPWGVSRLIWPEHWPGAQAPPPPDPGDEQGEFGFGELT